MPELMRGVHLVALAVLACSSSPAYVAPPMSAARRAPDALERDGEAPGALARGAFRPLPAEPTPPERTSGCKRETKCRQEEDEPTPRAFPPPFERCAAEMPNGGAAFSPRETREARIGDARACCYVAFRECARQIAEPLAEGGTRR